MQQRHKYSCAARANRMSECDCASVDIELRRIYSQFTRNSDGLDRERFVQFNKINVSKIPARSFQSLLNRSHRSHHNEFWFDPACGLRDNAGHMFAAELARRFRGRNYKRCGSVVHSGRISGRNRSVLLESRLQSRQRFNRSVLAGSLVGFDDQRRALLLRDLDRDDFAIEATLFNRSQRLAMRVYRVLILFLSADVIPVLDYLPGAAHMPVVERAPQAVLDHGIDQLAVAEPVALARSLLQVRRVGHRLHSTRDRDVNLADSYGIGRQHHSFQPGAANLVDCKRGHTVRSARSQRHLPGRILPVARLNDVAHYDFIDNGSIDAGPLDCSPSGDHSQINRAEIPERPKKLSHRRPCAGKYEYVCHMIPFTRVCLFPAVISNYHTSFARGESNPGLVQSVAPTRLPR